MRAFKLRPRRAASFSRAGPEDVLIVGHGSIWNRFASPQSRAFSAALPNSPPTPPSRFRADSLTSQ